MADLSSAYFTMAQEQVKNVRQFQGQSTTPLWEWVNKSEKMSLSDFQTRITHWIGMPTGITFFDDSNTSFRAPTAPVFEAMRVRPAMTAETIRLNGNIFIELKNGNKQLFLSLAERINMSFVGHKRYISRLLHGDGTGTLAIAQTNINSTGPATLAGQVSSGGSSAVASTKGTAHLVKNDIYDAINPATEAVRGTFRVDQEGRQSCSVNVLSGTVAVGDKIVVTGSWKKVSNGIRNLCDGSSRIVQGVDTALFPSFNSNVYDGGGNAVSPSGISYAKGMIDTALNDQSESNSKWIIMTPGHQKTLVNQEFAYRVHNDPKGGTVKGVFTKYVDQDGDKTFVDADAPDDQIRILEESAYKAGQLMPFGWYNLDGLKTRMLHGTNDAGSDTWFMSFGCKFNLMKKGVAKADVVYDNLAHVGADFLTQAS